MSSQIFVVTVTYNNRFHLLKKVVEATLREGVDKVIVVDNNSAPESREKLKKYQKKNRKVDVIYLPDNLGSAGGFKKGLEKAYKDPECKFIWLLDDDNKPEPGSLKKLKKHWEKLKEEKLAIASYRENYRINCIEALLSKDPGKVLGRKNSFVFNFHILDIPKYMKKLILGRLNIREKGDFKIPNSGQIIVAPYGGLFFNKKLLDVIGYPNEKLYLYCDDYEWTYRITDKGGKIILLMDARVEDIDRSWHVTDKKETPLSNFSPLNNFRIYYSIRNEFYFRMRHRVDNKLVYYLNCLILLLIILFHNMITIRDISPFKTALTAIKDAKKNRLGIKPQFKPKNLI